MEKCDLDLRNADGFILLGRYAWEQSELRVGKKCFEQALKLRPDSEAGSYLVDICMVLKEKDRALEVLCSSLLTCPTAKWVWLRFGLMLLKARQYNLAETSFQFAIACADSSYDRSERQPYECLARSCLRDLQLNDAINAFRTGAKVQCSRRKFRTQMSDEDIVSLEAADLRAMYSHTEQWVAQPQATSVQFAFSILYAIWPDLLRPVRSNFDQVTQARKAITKVYRELHQLGKRIDWREADTQCAYMMRFFLIHCQFVPELLRSTPKILTKFPKGNHLRVCCVGGGPGSDIIGLIAYLRSINRNTRLTCHVLDKFPEWMNVWKTIQPRLPPPSVNASYISLDTTSFKPLDTKIKEIVRQADIITFVKSVSPTAAFLKYLRAFMSIFDSPSEIGVIPSILRTVKSGALVLYIDNKQGDQNELFYNMAVSAGLRVIFQKVWKCNIGANVVEYNAVWHGFGCEACSSCHLQGYIFYKP